MTRKSIALPFSIALLAAIVAAAFFVFGNPARSEAAASPQIAVALVETGVEGTPGTWEDGTPALCFTVDMYDLKTNSKIGQATDCLAEIDDSGFPTVTLVAETTFEFPQGTLVSRGATTIQPLLVDPAGFTHSTGAPAPLTGSNIIRGTKAFKNAVGVGTVRLSGLVNLNDFPNTASFDCIFVIDLDGAN